MADCHKNAQFLLTSSSARKLRRGHANLLGGRAWRFELGPLCSDEIPTFDLQKALTAGLLPDHYLSPDPKRDLQAYVADYLKEEIAAEAITQNIPAFAEFLRIAALTSADLLNYTNVARETGVSAKVVRSYFQILEDTMLAERLHPWIKSPHRAHDSNGKIFPVDVGVANYLAKRTPLPQSMDFGKSFEHFIWMELRNFKRYYHMIWTFISGEHQLDWKSISFSEKNRRFKAHLGSIFENFFGGGGHLSGEH